MIDLETYFKQEAARYRLPKLLADNLAKQRAARSDRTRRGNITKAAQRRAGA